MGGNIEVGQRIQEKFNFYALALTFTLLGLAVQTAKFGNSRVGDAAELAGWLSLLFSGLFGLSRLEWTPHLYSAFSFHEEGSEGIRKLDNATKAVQTLPPGIHLPESETLEERRVKLGFTMEKISKQTSDLERKLETKYKWQRRLFVAGLIGVIIARGLPHFVHLLGYVLL